jgi:hypothetical protein
MATTKKTARKSTAKKSAPKKSAAPKQSHEEKLADQTIKWIEEASSLLRTGAKKAGTNRIAAAKKAQSLLGKASDSLTDALKGGTSALNKAVGKLGKP